MTAAPKSLRMRLAALSRLSGAESAIAAWMERNAAVLPFENAAAVAAGAGVSEMSVSRFVRRLGYTDFRSFKAELRTQTLRQEGDRVDDRLDRFSLPTGDADALDEAMRREMEAILEVYRMARTPAWSDALDLIDRADRISVTGFQASRGLALDFATRLEWVRPGVRFVGGTSGTWSEVFDEAPDRSCLLLVDTALYAQTSLRLARMAQDEGLPLVIVTDRFGTWARRFTPHVLSVSTQTGTWWDSSAGLSAILGLMLNGLALRLGPAARARLARLSALGRQFDAFASDTDAQIRAQGRRDERGETT